jgi:Family of unknown function (DUF6157)
MQSSMRPFFGARRDATRCRLVGGRDRDSFITIAPDCTAEAGTVPGRATSIAGLEYALLTESPYRLTGDDLLFAVHLQHKRIGENADLDSVRAAFFSKPHPCLRASMLPKRYGWGAHYDARGRIALYGAETGEYRRLATRKDLKIIPAMRNRKAS